MPNTTAQAEIRALVDSFVEDLTQHIRTAAVEAVQSALMNGGAPARATAAPKAQARQGKATGKKASASKQSGRRVRRTPEQIAAAKGKILNHVRSNPGTAMGDMSTALGEDSAVIRAQLNELLEEGALRKEGERRGTRYFAGNGRAGAQAKTRSKKTGKKGRGRKKGTSKK